MLRDEENFFYAGAMQLDQDANNGSSLNSLRASDGASEKQSRFTSAAAIILYIAGAKLVLHLVTAGRYGFFRDELYYLDCANHLDWGYVDQPPLIALIAWIARHGIGESLLALRLLPAIAGAALVWLTGKLAAEMGGGRFAQVLAALTILIVPFYLILHHWLTMNAFEPLIWMGCAWCILRAVNTQDARYWLFFGILMGIGLETKYSIAFFLLGILIGLLLTPERRFLVTSWMWLGASAAFAIFLPNLIWLVRHDFPFLELMLNVRMSGRDIARAPLPFLGDQAMAHNPVLFPLWLGGLLWLLCARRGRPYRALGIAFIAVLAAFILLKGKNYYVSPVYPMMFAAGAVALEQLTRGRWHWVRTVYPALVIGAGVLIAPIVVPILSPESMIQFQAALGYPVPEFEHHPHGLLPQYFADEFGWEEMARETARVYHNLPSSERAKAAIFANDYGEAGAVNFFGARYGLPKAVSNHQNYWLWGSGSATGEVVIVLGSDGQGDRDHFRKVEAAGRVEHRYSRADEHFTIWICHGLLFDFREAWPDLKNWS